ncbi:MAG: hypothetical protein PHD82_15120 [Candidatus Riflebacteria bacterium]|jgi:hypothetical protein|nr:hypothetical protein [Candidatus Riflebacteria bacterium]
MKKVKFAVFPKNIITSFAGCHKAGPEALSRLHKQWSDNLKARSRARRIIFSTGANTCKIDGLKDFRIKFVLSRAL